MSDGSQRSLQPVAGGKRCIASGAEVPVPEIDQRIYDALSYLHAFALALDAERHRSAVRLDAQRAVCAAPCDCSELEQHNRELTEELEALRTVITKLREYADPDGRYL